MGYPNQGLVALGVALALGTTGAYATNGMNLAGYGPEAAGMGGASMAYDNGPAAMMNNPATLSLMANGNRFDLALGFLGPSVTTKMKDATGKVVAEFDSESNAFYMPALGWVRSSGKLSYGVGMFAQGGMGTEYPNGPGAAGAAGMLMMGQSASGFGVATNPIMTMSGPAMTPIATVAGLQERSEVSVGRFIIPISYRATDRLSIGGSIDYVWANMDIQMAMPGAQMYSMMGSGAISGSMVNGLNGMMTAGMVNDMYYGYFDFSDDSDYTGAAQGAGMGGKLGLTYQLTPSMTVGMSYHSETSLDDLEADDASMTMAISGDQGVFGAYMANPAGGLNPVNATGTYMNLSMDVTGTMMVKDFQWPSTFGLGFAYRPTRQVMLAMDWKRINWEAVMKDFKLSFVADNSAANGPFAGATLDATMAQDWKDQDVIALGGAYSPDDTWTFRMGLNYSPNPIPSSTLNYLFPAIVENHMTFGTSYNFTQRSGVDFAFWLVSRHTQTSDATTMDTTMRQFNWQIAYRLKF